MSVNNNAASPRAVAQQKYTNARANLLLMIAFTVINIVLLMFESDTMFLFSATVPYMSVVMGTLSEYSALLTMSIVLAAVTVLLYLLCWFLSKKHYAWMIVALIMFVLDRLARVEPRHA